MPLAAIISIDELKAWLALDPTDATRDDMLTSLANAASDECFRELAWDFRSQDYAETLNGKGGRALPLNNFPITAVSSLSIFRGAPSLAADQYTHDENLVYLLNGSFPRGIQNIAITYTAGLSATPDWAKLAAKYTTKAMWDARKTDMNSTGEQFNGIGGASFWPSGPGSVPPQALDLLRRFKNVYKVPA